MANDREFIIQPLISEGRVLELSDVNPATTYLQVGVWQADQQRANSPKNAYPSYAIPLSEIIPTIPLVTDMQNYLLVDEIYGNDATAVPYDTHKPYQTINAAILAAQNGDTIVINPGSYVSTQNIMRQSQTYYCMPGVNWTVMAAFSTSSSESLKIYGHGDIIITPIINVQGNYNGDIIIECNNLTLTNYAYLIPSSNTNVPRTFRIRAKTLTQNGITGMIVAVPWVLDIEVNTYYGLITGSGSPGLCDFWLNNDLSLSGDTTHKVKITNAEIYHSSDASVFNFSVGGDRAKMFIEIDNLVVTNPPALNGGPFFLRIGPSGWTISAKVGQGKLTNCTILTDQSIGVPKVLLEGKYYCDTSSGSGSAYTPVYVGALTLESRADIIANPGTNPVYDILTTGKVDINNCKVINTNAGLTAIGIKKDGGAGSKLRLKDAKVYASVSIEGLTGGGEPCEVYACYTNSAPVNMTNSLSPATAFVTSASITDNNF